jgi:NADH-quinone oxidoreductase subunit L
MILAGLSFWVWYGANPIDPANGWFMKKWVVTPAQIVPQNTAPHWAHEGAAPAHEEGEHKAAEPTDNSSYAVFPPEGQHAVVHEPMAHQEVLEHKTHEVASTGMMISIIVALSGIALAWFLYLKNTKLVDKIATGLAPLYRFSFRKWYIDELYDYAVVGTFMMVARAFAWFDSNIIDGIVNGTAKVTVILSRVGGWIDKYIVDGLVNLSAGLTQFFGLMFRSVQTGKIQTYMAWTLAGVVIMYFVVTYVFVGRI